MAKMRPDWTVAAEPVKEWEDFKGADGNKINLLKEFYDRRSSDSFRRLQVR
jgi:hypothetical protein